MEKEKKDFCRLKSQGFRMGSCLVESDGKKVHACKATLKMEKNQIFRLITSIHLSRPENYLSIYQSGCNFSCKKCHSWYFSKVRDGTWYSPEDILDEAKKYEKNVTLTEPRERVTAWHAHDSCHCCGSCVINNERSPGCPGVLPRESVVLSPQGFGPARDIVAFTGGDITCCPEFYCECAKLIKAQTNLKVLIETNGYGLTDENLLLLKESGVDSFWLDIKAFDKKNHKWLTGCSNEEILELPEKILESGFVLEVLSLYIPGLVETYDLEQIATVLVKADPEIPFTILAFFPEYKMKDYSNPTVQNMVEAYKMCKKTGLRNIRLGNLGVFITSAEDREFLRNNVDQKDF